MRSVGILGGMGPEATVLLMQRLIASVPARDDADHIPLIVDQNPQVPSRIAKLIDGTGADPEPVLVGMAARLERAGAAALAMPCNTAHHFAPAIRAAVDIPFVDMVTLSAAHARRLGAEGSRVGILASPAVRRIGLFDAALKLHGLSPLYYEDTDVALSAIRSIKSQGPTPEACASLNRMSEDLARRHASIQLIACTEFSLLAPPTVPFAQVIDAMDVLVAAIVAFARDEDIA